MMQRYLIYYSVSDIIQNDVKLICKIVQISCVLLRMHLAINVIFLQPDDRKEIKVSG